MDSNRLLPTGAGAMVLATALAGAIAPCRAQTSSEPRLILSLFGGVAAGRDIWTVARQPLLVLGTELAPQYDTLRLSRQLHPGLVLGLSGTVFRSARLGLSAEMVFLGLSTEDRCTLVYENPDASSRNSQLCGNISSSGVTPTTVAFSVGGVVRPLPRVAVSPYLRAQAGIAAQSGSFVAVVGSFVEGGTRLSRIVINDKAGGRVAPTVGAAAGIMVPTGPGNQLRLEMRDQILFPQRVTGPASDLNQATAPTAAFALHSVSLTVALDVVLEQKRGRRYLTPVPSPSRERGTKVRE